MPLMGALKCVRLAKPAPAAMESVVEAGGSDGGEVVVEELLLARHSASVFVRLY